MNSDDIKFLEPWYATDQSLTAQLNREISKEHVLYGKNVETIARRQDNDEVLFKVIDPDTDFKYAVVHLTWSQSRHKNIEYPHTRIFKNAKEVFENLICIDNIEWEE